MLNIVVYEDNDNFMKKNINSINLAFADNDLEYRILKFNKYSNELEEIINNKNIKKIYILDVEMNGITGLEVASKIREDDWDSVIIFATAYDKYHNDVFYSRLMVLDFICKYNGYEDRLKEDIKAAIGVLYKQKIFVFKYNNIVYRVPYSSINYIEKEPLIKRCVIHTINNQFYIVKSINWLNDNLDNSFYRSHQSCIVNLNNIKEVDCTMNIIAFKNGESTYLLANKNKKELKDYVGLNK